MSRILKEGTRDNAILLHVNGMSRGDVAKTLGVSRSYVTKLVRTTGNGRPQEYFPETLPELKARFYAKIKVDTATCCWEWTAAHNKNKYAVIGRGGKVIWAHRLAYELEVGELPQDRNMVLDHLCRNVGCVNPKHLQLVEQKENIRRGRVAKITADQVREIRTSYAAGDRSWSKYATQYGLTKRHIGYIINRQSWKDI